jgi:ribosomal protein S18 acetylase RimI-like enzyme
VIKFVDIALQPEALRVLELQRVSYQIEADLIGSSILPLRETLEELQSCGEVFHRFFDSGRLLGFIAHKFEAGLLGICRIAVHQDAFRRGIARQLLEFVLNLEPSTECAVVETGSLNTPTCKLYLSCEFTVFGSRVVELDLSITTFSKNFRGAA